MSERTQLHSITGVHGALYQTTHDKKKSQTACMNKKSQKCQHGHSLTAEHNQFNAHPTLTYLLHVKKRNRQDHFISYSNKHVTLSLIYYNNTNATNTNDRKVDFTFTHILPKSGAKCCIHPV